MKREQVARLYESVRKINYAYACWASAHGLTLYEMQIYYVILEGNRTFITQKELCSELDAPKTSINSIVKKQLKAGYIEMNTNSANRREKVISLTDKGKAFAQALILPLFRYEEEAISRFAGRDLEQAIRTQGEFAEALFQKVSEKNESTGN